MTTRHRLARALLVAVAAAIALTVAAPAGATTGCAKKILADWLDNSRVDGVYQLHCYGDAVDAIPPEIRDYSDAADAISQAFAAETGRHLAVREKGPSVKQREIIPTVNTGSASSVPIPLIVLSALALGLLAAGGAGYVARRRRAGEIADADRDDPRS